MCGTASFVCVGVAIGQEAQCANVNGCRRRWHWALFQGAQGGGCMVYMLCAMLDLLYVCVVYGCGHRGHCFSCMSKRVSQPLHKRFAGAALPRLHSVTPPGRLVTLFNGCTVLCCGRILCACIQAAHAFLGGLDVSDARQTCTHVSTCSYFDWFMSVMISCLAPRGATTVSMCKQHVYMLPESCNPVAQLEPTSSTGRHTLALPFHPGTRDHTLT